MFRPILACLISLSALSSIGASEPRVDEPRDDAKKLILMIAGAPSHGYGAHEHYAGLKILESSVAGSDCEVRVAKGWPEDQELISRANALVFYSDGQKKHPALPHLDQIESKVAEGCGLAAIHYAVETVPGEQGDRWLNLMGGHFEIHRSVNPHWEATFGTFPKHPITEGITPFSSNDEWYFYLRFRDAGVTPLLQAVAPENTMRRKDGAHSGNPSVRKSVAAGETQTLAWAFDRAEADPKAKGRSFGITGGHFHWVWALDSMRNLTANGIRWTAGLPSKKDDRDVTYDDLLVNQDFPQPKRFDESAVEPYLGSAVAE